MKIVFMGTPDLAAEVLDTMMKSGCEVTLAVTQPDRPKGRGRGVIRTPVHECADKWGIPVFSPERVKRPEAVQRLREEAPDLIVVAAFGQILSQEILDLPRYGCVSFAKIQRRRADPVGGDQRRREERSHDHADGRRT